MNRKLLKKIEKKSRQDFFELHPDIPDIILHLDYLDDKLVSVDLFSPKKKYKDLYPIVVKPIFWEFIKNKNPFYDNDLKDIVFQHVDLVDMDVNPKDVVFINYQSYLIFDRNLELIPIVYDFDYVGTPFDEYSCDLEKMLEYLKKHPWVINREDLRIIDIPYYNREKDNQYFICGKKLDTYKYEYIKILPDKDSLNEMWNLVKKRDFPSCRLKDLILSMYKENKDYLGIHPFLKFDNIWNL